MTKTKILCEDFGGLTDIHDGPAALKTRFAERMRAPGENCGLCMKPFNTVRRPAGLVGFDHRNDSGIVLSEYLLCRACLREYRKRGPAALAVVKADALEAARCLLTPAEGGVQ